MDYLCIAGPTASGKTAAALAIAQRHRVEIVSVDSALVYRGMDIGTAKPSAQELAQVPHHLINIRDPLQAYSAAEFARDATRLIAEIRARGALPLLVGGTMLYFKALWEGLDEMPAADPLVRAGLEAQAALVGWPAMHAQLALVDPATAARLAPADSQRIQRALEVWQVSGRALSSFHQNKNATKDIATKRLFTLAPRVISLEPASRAWLHSRIAQRFAAMLQAGLVAEVQALRARGDLSPELPSMRCVGYRQAWELLDAPPLNAATLQELGTIATRQLAKRQLTWMRSFPDRTVVPCDAPAALHKVLSLVDQWTAP